VTNLLWDMGADLQRVDLVDQWNAELEIIDNQSFFDFEILATDEYVFLLAVSAYYYCKDKIYTIGYGARWLNNKQLFINQIAGILGIGRIKWTNADSSGYVRHLQNGTFTSFATINNKTRSYTYTLSGQSDPTYTHISDNDGWVRKNNNVNIDQRCTSGGNKTMYSTMNHSTETYVRDGSCWCADLDLTCMSVWNSRGVARRAGTLISPCHILFARHYSLAVGDTVRYVTNDNVVVNRTIISRSLLNNDMAVARLDSDVPSTISFAKVLPQEGFKYLPEITRWLALLTTDQEKKALVTEIFSNIFYSDAVVIGQPQKTVRKTFYEVYVTGDSGSPVFLVINDELVVIGMAWGNYYISNVNYNHDEVNNALIILGGGYELTPIDLSNFQRI
jgi:hypothetical protein